MNHRKLRKHTKAQTKYRHFTGLQLLKVQCYHDVRIVLLCIYYKLPEQPNTTRVA